ncbi:MAG TPA: FMN-dependent NADH-azoreductase, partial [Firmicutes bacterium]|nr:FMN-dependent NADH-azoreductase [Bacillota bacterium]
MKKILYISVNSKPEVLSSSKTVARALINQLNNKGTYLVDELDLYRDHIPRLQYEFFESKNCLIKEEAFQQLSEDAQKEAHQIVKLCDQFKEADV